MYRIAITGKANTGKNTVSKLILKQLWGGPSWIGKYKFMAFADPIKEMARLAFPQIPRKWLYGPSEYRDQIIPGALKDGTPLTVRQLLIELGNDLGRKYKSDIWINNFDHRLQKIYKKQPKIVIVTDCRFRNEFDHLKDLGFFHIRINRKYHSKINDISETNQDGILDNEFNFVLHNDGSKTELKEHIQRLLPLLHEQISIF